MPPSNRLTPTEVSDEQAQSTILRAARKAFYRLADRLKARFPRLPLCLLLAERGLFAGGPAFALCQRYSGRHIAFHCSPFRWFFEQSVCRGGQSVMAHPRVEPGKKGN